MLGLKIDAQKCVGCGLCTKACPSNALSMENSIAVVNDQCTACSFCIDACPCGAIKLESSKSSETDLSEFSDIWVFIEHQNNQILDVSYELIGKARELADKKQCRVCSVMIGKDVSDYTKELIAYGSDLVYLCDTESSDENLYNYYTDVFTKLVEDYKPDIVLIGATGLGRSLAPRIAARVKTGLTADCTILDVDETGLLMQTRPAFGGNLMATIVCPNHRPQMASVRPGIMLANEADYSRQGEVVVVDYVEPLDESIRIVKEIIAPSAETIAESEVIIDVGRGIGSQKNMKLAERLAELLGGKVGVTRPLVDTGWGEHTNQIGQTGTSVAPKLLIAIGVSGAIQHLAGISRAETIIAINIDSEAPIFNIANYKIVGDSVEVMTTLISQLENEVTDSNIERFMEDRTI